MSRAAERTRLKALVNGERVIVTQAPPRQLESTSYELPIMRALVERGAAAPRREIIAAVGATMARGRWEVSKIGRGKVRREEKKVGRVRFTPEQVAEAKLAAA